MINTLTFLNGTIRNCLINSVVITLGSGSTAHILDSYSGVPGVGTPTIDMGGSGQNLGLRGYNGGIKIQNMTGASDNATLDMNSGQVILDSTCTDGTIVVRGISALTDNSTGSTVNTDGLNNATVTADTIWGEARAAYTDPTTFGGFVNRLLSFGKWIALK